LSEIGLEHGDGSRIRRKIRIDVNRCCRDVKQVLTPTVWIYKILQISQHTLERCDRAHNCTLIYRFHVRVTYAHIKNFKAIVFSFIYFHLIQYLSTADIDTFSTLCVLVHRCLNGAAPQYLSELIQALSDVDSRRRLRSASTLKFRCRLRGAQPLATVLLPSPVHVLGTIFQ